MKERFWIFQFNAEWNTSSCFLKEVWREVQYINIHSFEFKWATCEMFDIIK